ncbi:septation protein SepH [Isoptericola hypogeus]|uniref:Septation protein SepH n=1 Tax=Isoptericola hypogeus TaxID=300179 RepID=A0ABN2JV47_9MICO
MAELELARLHEDGEHLVLRAPDGAEHSLAISEALRAAVRRDRPRAEALAAQATATMRPRDVQARLRAGATVEELAAESGLPVDHVRRYEWPVAAERDHAVGQVRAHRLTGDGEPVTLGDVADTRLAARGVTSAEAHWSARRDGTAPWVVEVRFSAGDRDRSARWTYDPKGRVVTALDDEARWLGQPDDPVSPEVLGVPSALGRGGPARRSPDLADDATALLLDDLAGRRGQRTSPRPRRPDDAQAPGPAAGARPQAESLHLGLVPAPAGTASSAGPSPDAARDPGPRGEPGAEPGDGAGTEPTGDGHEAPAAEAGASVVDLGSRRAGVRSPEERSTHPSGSRRATDPDGEPSGAARPGVPRTGDVADPEVPAPSVPPAATPGPQPSAPRAGKSAARRPGRKGRPQVPSWDEIVFGGGRPSS